MSESNDTGASAAEYALLVAAVAAVIVAIIFVLGGVVFDVFDSSCEQIASKASTSNC
jgi:pilus assembly protein Flp/PilA